MILEDNAMKYNTYYEKVSKAIDKLKSININTSKLEKELDKIEKELKKDIKTIDVGINNFGIEIYYSNAISELQKLLNIINDYNFYY